MTISSIISTSQTNQFAYIKTNSISQKQQQDAENLSPEVIVKAIIKSEQGEEARRIEKRRIIFTPSTKDETYWREREESYLEIEGQIRENVANIPRWEIAGPLDYSMTLKKMKEVLEMTFRKMAASGHLLHENSIKGTRKDYFPPTGKGKNNLTRIWGAEFLKSHLANHPTFRATDHFLIINENATELEVTAWHGEYLCLSSVENAHILAKNIDGEKAAWLCQNSQLLDQLGYKDFADPGNIRLDSNGTCWIVDTEINSFKSPSLQERELQSYLQKRFRILSDKEYDGLKQTFKIPLSSIGILEKPS